MTVVGNISLSIGIYSKNIKLERISTISTISRNDSHSLFSCVHDFFISKLKKRSSRTLDIFWEKLLLYLSCRFDITHEKNVKEKLTLEHCPCTVFMKPALKLFFIHLLGDANSLIQNVYTRK